MPKTIYMPLPPKRTAFQIGIDKWPHLWMVPGNRWISHTHNMWLWGHSLFKISSPRPVFYGTKWLLWCPHKQRPTFHSKWRIDKGLIKMGKHNKSLKVAVQGLDYYGPPLMHSFIHSFIQLCLRHNCLWTSSFKLRDGWLYELTKDWLQVVWNRRPIALLRKQGMLELDAFKGHSTLKIRSDWCNEYWSSGHTWSEDFVTT
jgi:hypothetical protein